MRFSTAMQSPQIVHGVDRGISTREQRARVGTDRLREALIIATALVLGLFLRQRDGFLHPQFWAEDGTIFFRDDLLLGVKAVLTPYAGYINLYPRAVAFLGSVFPVAIRPTIYSAGDVAVFILVGLRALSPRLPFGTWTRRLMALAIVYGPAQGEVFLTVTNSQWVLALALIQLMFIRPAETIAEWLGDVSMGVLGAFTGPFSLIFVPFFVVRALRKRSAFSILTCVIMGAAATVQSFAIAGSKKTAAGSLGPIREFARAFDNIPGQMFMGHWGRPAPSEPLLVWTIAALGLVVLLGVSVSAMFRGRCEQLVLIACGLIVFGSALFKDRYSPEIFSLGAERYAYIPIVVFTWAIVANLSVTRWASCAALAAGLAIFVIDHRSSPRLDYDWKREAVCFEKEEHCAVPINPPGWVIRT